MEYVWFRTTLCSLTCKQLKYQEMGMEIGNYLKKKWLTFNKFNKTINLEDAQPHQLDSTGAW